MADVPRDTLRELIRNEGVGLVENLQEFETLLNQEIPRYPIQIQVFVRCLKQNVPQTLLKAPEDQDWDSLAQPLVQRLVDSYGLAEETAVWAIESWALALGIAQKKRKVSLEEMVEPPPPLETETGASPESADSELTHSPMTQLIILGLCGAVGGLFGGLFIGAILGALLGKDPKTFQVVPASMAGTAFGTMFGGVAGALGAAIGSLIGWMFGGGFNVTGSSEVFSWVKVTFGAGAALLMGFVGALLGGALCGLSGLFLGTLLWVAFWVFAAVYLVTSVTG